MMYFNPKNFQDICLNWNGECYRQTGIINLLKMRHEFEEHGIGVTFPRANTHGSPIYLAFNVGGVEVFKNDSIKVNILICVIHLFSNQDCSCDETMVLSAIRFSRTQSVSNPMGKCSCKIC